MTTSDATGERTKRKSLPSYMKPTATSKLKENVYGVDQRFTLIKSKEARCISPEHHELDYIPPPPPPPGIPSFMRPTKTWGGKVSDRDRRKPRSRKVRRRASCNATMQTPPAASSTIAPGASTTTTSPVGSVSMEPRTPCPAQRPALSSPTSNSSTNNSNSVESIYTPKPKLVVVPPLHPPIERRKSSYCLAPRPSFNNTFDDSPFIQSRPSTLAEAIRETLIRTAPVSDSRKLESMEGHAGSAVGPSTPTMKPSRSRRRELPRYMQPTAASKARLRE